MRQVTLTMPDNFYPTFLDYLKDNPEVLVDENMNINIIQFHSGNKTWF